MPAQKRKSNYSTKDSFVVSDDDNDGGNSAIHSAKRAKTNTTAAFTPSSKPQRDSDNNTYWEISKARRVTISDFKGKKMVSIREYYEKDGSWLPGKKGITMTLEQYGQLLEFLPAIEKELVKAGVDEDQIVRPKYNNEDPAEVKDEDVDADEQEENDGGGKANFEATSDEEE